VVEGQGCGGAKAKRLIAAILGIHPEELLSSLTEKLAAFVHDNSGTSQLSCESVRITYLRFRSAWTSIDAHKCWKP
jgi:hypothetical protein